MAGSSVAVKITDKKNNATTSRTKYKNQSPKMIATTLTITPVEMSIVFLSIYFLYLHQFLNFFIVLVWSYHRQIQFAFLEHILAHSQDVLNSYSINFCENFLGS
ncbi:MAG: hypothetical protein ACD_67C00102G0005 [uncultured bacterium]|nr:MAG: hypothetical protein ACD_67C00102G0005 [uncultured bacterium]